MSTLSDALKTAKEIYFLIELEMIGTKKRYATGEARVPYSAGSAKSFKGQVISLSGIGSFFSTGSWDYSDALVSVDLINKDRIQDMEAIGGTENAYGSVYLWTPGLDWADIETEGLLFRGIFEPKRYDINRYSFNLRDYSDQKWKMVPGTSITTTTWPNARVIGGSGSVMGAKQPLVFGSWTKGVPLQCIDTTAFKYVLCYGVVQSVDADYTAGTVDVYDSAGSVVDPAGYTFSNVLDGAGNSVSVFDFTADQVASEPLTCSVYGLYDGSDLINHPADIVSYLMQNYSILGLDEMDIASVETMKAVLPGLKFASIINSNASAMDVVDRILRQCLVSRVQRNGKVGVVAMSLYGHAVGHILWDRHLVNSSPTISRTPLSEVINKICVRYALNPDTGSYESEFTLDRMNDERCELSYRTYGERPEYTLNLSDVQDEGTARAIAARLLGFKSARHDIIETEVSYWDGIDFKDGDAALLSIREGASATGAGWTDEKCILLDRKFNPRTISQRWWKVGTR